MTDRHQKIIISLARITLISMLPLFQSALQLVCDDDVFCPYFWWRRWGLHSCCDGSRRKTWTGSFFTSLWRIVETWWKCSSVFKVWAAVGGVHKTMHNFALASWEWSSIHTWKLSSKSRRRCSQSCFERRKSSTKMNPYFWKLDFQNNY